MQSEPDLRQALLTLERIAGPGVRFAEAVERGRVRRVEDVEDLGDDLSPEVAAEDEVLRDADVELRERGAAPLVDLRHAGREVARVSVAVRVGEVRVEDVVRQRRTVAEEARDLDVPRRGEDAAEGEAVTGVGVERPVTVVALRV